MKRFIAAVSFAVAAVPAFAQPYEQLQIDRALPEIYGKASAGATAERPSRALPFEQTQFDRGL